jgi:hypothetical protein
VILAPIKLKVFLWQKKASIGLAYKTGIVTKNAVNSNDL